MDAVLWSFDKSKTRRTLRLCLCVFWARSGHLSQTVRRRNVVFGLHYTELWRQFYHLLTDFRDLPIIVLFMALCRGAALSSFCQLIVC